MTKKDEKEFTLYTQSREDCRTYCKCGASVTMGCRVAKKSCHACGKTVINRSRARFRLIMNGLKDKR